MKDSGKILRVLHLPTNIASQITITVRALRDLGISARGIAPQGIITANEELEYLADVSKSLGLKRYLNYGRRCSQIIEAISWADVVHWHSGWCLPGAFDLQFAHLLGKKQIVEFWGSDIRIAEIEAADNPYYAKLLKVSDFNFQKNLKSSYSLQKRFSRLGSSAMTSCRSMFPYIDKESFPNVHFVRQRVYLADYAPLFPDPNTQKPLVIHSPSRQLLKGTLAVRSAIKQLQEKYSFKFQLVENMHHNQAKELMQKCDIFVDQFVLGAHGLASLEAMAYGKPVVCYIKTSMIDKYPSDLPIVNANQENLPDVLSKLLEDGDLRHELGRRGRAYIEKYHDAHLLAKQLVEIYKNL
jgi:glycosyltransferase involved in cell wall biosynthesis